MGIKGLFQFLQKQAPESIKVTTFDELKGRTIAIDSALTMYQFLTATQYLNKAQQIVELKDSQGIFNRTTNLLKKDIKPLWVFDGPVSPQKEQELKRRREVREKAQQRMDASQDMNVKLKYKVQTVRVSMEMKQDAQKMLSLLGLPWVESEGEGEALCAQLSAQGLVDVVASEDLDTMPFGALSLLRGLNQKKDSSMHLISLPDILQQLSISQPQFIDFCILCGSDFSPKINQIGPHKAFSLIKEFNNIEAVLSHINQQHILNNPKYKKVTIPPSFHQDFLFARSMFDSQPVSQHPQFKTMPFTISDVPQKFYDFMVYEKRFKMDRINKALESIIQ